MLTTLNWLKRIKNVANFAMHNDTQIAYKQNFVKLFSYFFWGAIFFIVIACANIKPGLSLQNKSPAQVLDIIKTTGFSCSNDDHYDYLQNIISDADEKRTMLDILNSRMPESLNKGYSDMNEAILNSCILKNADSSIEDDGLSFLNEVHENSISDFLVTQKPVVNNYAAVYNDVPENKRTLNNIILAIKADENSLEVEQNNLSGTLKVSFQITLNYNFENQLGGTRRIILSNFSLQDETSIQTSLKLSDVPKDFNSGIISANNNLYLQKDVQSKYNYNVNLSFEFKNYFKSSSAYYDFSTVFQGHKLLLRINNEAL